MAINAFTPQGPQSRVTANTTAAVGVQLPVFGAAQLTAFRVYNANIEAVTIGYGQSAQAATNAAVLPTGNTTATASSSFTFPAGAVEVWRAPYPNPFFSILTPTTNGNVFIIPGEGM